MTSPQTTSAEVGEGLHDCQDAATWRVSVQVHRGRPVAVCPRLASCLRRDAEREQRAGSAGDTISDLSKGITGCFYGRFVFCFSFFFRFFFGIFLGFFGDFSGFFLGTWVTLPLSTAACRVGSRALLAHIN